MTATSRISDGANDPYLWLEDISGPRADTWTRAESRRAEAALDGPRTEADRVAALAILDSDDRIAWISRRGTHVYNLWTDAAHPRGLWRRTTLASFKTPAPDWESVLDIDALSAREGRSWKFAGATALPPTFERALVRLSPGGSDAVEIREFDLVGKTFVEGGFHLPQAKCWAEWLDVDTLLVGHAEGAAHTTASGYARTVRRLRRGQPLAAADVVFSIAETDMGVWASVEHAGDQTTTVLVHTLDFFRHIHWVERAPQPRQRLDIPETARCSTLDDRLAIQPREDWTVGGQTIPAGALAVTSLAGFLDGKRDLPVLFVPTARRALEGWTLTPSAVLLNINENVVGHIEVARPDGGGGWSTSPLPGLPGMASLAATTLDSHDGPVGDDVLVTAMTFTQPPTLALWTGSGAPAVLKHAPAAFDAGDIDVAQYEAAAPDGTAIPYFVVGRRGALAAPGASRPAILYGYGGFEVTQGPAYLGIAGRLWIGEGGLYAIANIRGGGEFGPAWHEAGRRAKKAVSHDDFAAVAHDLAARGLTSAAQLACWGGSNGGLLVGNMITRYPERFGAAICAVPLLDMARYTRLLAGASWIAEYGDPDDPKEWPFIERFSPYHQVRPGVRMPPTFFITSRNDDRVHPGHARKMAARMQEMGHDMLFWENVEGGHGGSADNAQTARRSALCYSFLRRTIGAAQA